MKTALGTIVSASGKIVSDFLFPPACSGCGRMTASHGALCTSCWGQVRYIERPYCEVMGTPFAYDLGKGILSPKAIADPPPFDRLRAAVAYDGIARSVVHDLKYRDRLEIADMMACWMMRAAGEHIRSADYIIPVPLHRIRFFFRKFNQSAELARALTRLSGTPLLVGDLLRTRHTNHQVGLALRQREDNVRGAFALSEEGKLRLSARRIVLVDDVYTTGATIAACARALRKAGPEDITVVTFAMALNETI